MLPNRHQHHHHDRHHDILSDSRARERIRRRKQEQNRRNNTTRLRVTTGASLMIGILSFSLSLTLMPGNRIMVLAFSNDITPTHPTVRKINNVNHRLMRIQSRLSTAQDHNCYDKRYQKIYPLLMAANSNGEDNASSNNNDTAGESVDPKKQAISALSQPNTNQNNNEGSSILPPPLERPSSNNKKNPHAKMHPSKKYLHAPKSKKNSSESSGADTKPRSQQQRRSNNNNASNKRNNNNGNTPAKASASSKQSLKGRDRYASMLPPPLRDPNDYVNEDDDSESGSPSDQSSLSSWEQFLGAKRRPVIFSSPPPASAPAAKARATAAGGTDTTSATTGTTGPNNTNAEDELSQPPPSMAKLPSIHDLFPPDLSSMASSDDKKNSNSRSGPGGDNATSRSNSQSDRAKSSRNEDRPRSTSNRDKRQRSSNSNNRGPATPENTRRASDSLSDSLSATASSIPGASSSKKQQQRQTQSSGKMERGETSQQDTSASLSTPPKQQQQQQQSSLEGVLPVSDLFYRSAQSMDNMDGDDEELPFSAEQSDQLAVDHNKVKIRRNQATESPPPGGGRTRKKNGASGNNKNNNNSRSPQNKNGTAGRRRMVRRGMEMLVGGVAINADPPQRNVELWYDTTQPWYATISVNSRDFGPFFHSDSQHLLSRTELGLFCEFFVHYAMKWDVCPKELRSLVEDFWKEESSETAVSTDAADIVSNASLLTSSSQSPKEEINVSIDLDSKVFKDFQQELGISEAETASLKFAINSAKDTMSLPSDALEVLDELDDDAIAEILASFREQGGSIEKLQGRQSRMKKGKEKAIVDESKRKGFGKQPLKAKKKKTEKLASVVLSKRVLGAQGDLQFVIGLTQEELETAGDAFQDVLKRGILNSVNKELQHACLRGDTISGELEVQRVELSILSQSEIYDGQTSTSLGFSVFCKPCLSSESFAATKAKRLQRLTTAMERAIDDGELHIALAAAAKEEERWSPELRERIYEEFLFEEDEEDNVVWDKDQQSPHPTQIGGRPSTSGDGGVPERDDQLMFGSSSGVTWDYSHGNAENAPFKGKLGPRLVETMEKRAKEHPPKVITVGDVHGCVDELQDLLRQCDYYPGDLIVFLGDLVSKGPDSISVVQMSREIGAIGVRGNHDFEVIRWHQAIKSGMYFCQ